MNNYNPFETWNDDSKSNDVDEERFTDDDMHEHSNDLDDAWFDDDGSTTMTKDDRLYDGIDNKHPPATTKIKKPLSDRTMQTDTFLSNRIRLDSNRRTKTELRTYFSKFQSDDCKIEKKTHGFRLFFGKLEWSIIKEFAKSKKIAIAELIRTSVREHIERAENEPLTENTDFYGNKNEQLIYLLCAKFNVDRNTIINQAMADLLAHHQRIETFDFDEICEVDLGRKFRVKEENPAFLTDSTVDSHIYRKWDYVRDQYQVECGY